MASVKLFFLPSFLRFRWTPDTWRMGIPVWLFALRAAYRPTLNPFHPGVPAP